MLKKILRSEIGQAVLSWLIAQLIHWTGKSIRWETVRPEIAERMLRTTEPRIGVFWHNRIMLMTHLWHGESPLAMLQSPHPDGRLIARAINRLGFLTIWGSSSKGKGGAAGLRNIVKALKDGVVIGVTPDGPRGPRMRMEPGVIVAARMSGAAIVPLAWNVSHRKLLGTWDRMIFARPFSRGVWVWGEPIHIPKDGDIEEWRQKVEDSLNAVSAEADRHFGHTPIEPAPPRKRAVSSASSDTDTVSETP